MNQKSDLSFIEKFNEMLFSKERHLIFTLTLNSKVKGGWEHGMSRIKMNNRLTLLRAAVIFQSMLVVFSFIFFTLKVGASNMDTDAVLLDYTNKLQIGLNSAPGVDEDIINAWVRKHKPTQSFFVRIEYGIIVGKLKDGTPIKAATIYVVDPKKSSGFLWWKKFSMVIMKEPAWTLSRVENKHISNGSFEIGPEIKEDIIQWLDMQDPNLIIQLPIEIHFGDLREIKSSYLVAGKTKISIQLDDSALSIGLPMLLKSQCESEICRIFLEGTWGPLIKKKKTSPSKIFAIRKVIGAASDKNLNVRFPKN